MPHKPGVPQFAHVFETNGAFNICSTCTWTYISGYCELASGKAAPLISPDTFVPDMPQ